MMNGADKMPRHNVAHVNAGMYDVLSHVDHEPINIFLYDVNQDLLRQPCRKHGIFSKKRNPYLI